MRAPTGPPRSGVAGIEGRVDGFGQHHDRTFRIDRSGELRAVEKDPLSLAYRAEAGGDVTA